MFHIYLVLPNCLTKLLFRLNIEAASVLRKKSFDKKFPEQGIEPYTSW